MLKSSTYITIMSSIKKIFQEFDNMSNSEIVSLSYDCMSLLYVVVYGSMTV